MVKSVKMAWDCLKYGKQYNVSQCLCYNKNADHSVQLVTCSHMCSCIWSSWQPWKGHIIIVLCSSETKKLKLRDMKGFVQGYSESRQSWGFNSGLLILKLRLSLDATLRNSKLFSRDESLSGNELIKKKKTKTKGSGSKITGMALLHLLSKPKSSFYLLRKAHVFSALELMHLPFPTEAWAANQTQKPEGWVRHKTTTPKPFPKPIGGSLWSQGSVQAPSLCI